MATGDVSTLRVVGRYQGQNVVNTMHYKHTDQQGGDQDILRDLCIAWSNGLQSAWLARHNAAYELVGIKAFVKKGSAKTPGYLTVSQPGVVVVDQVPSMLCRTITLYTADLNHRIRGRVMISGSNAGMFDVADGSVDLTELGLMQVLADALLVQLTEATNLWDLVLPETLLGGPYDVVDAKARVTPAAVTSRRVRQFLIG